MTFQADYLIYVVPGGPDLDLEIRPCNVRRDLCSLLQALRRQSQQNLQRDTSTQICQLILFDEEFGVTSKILGLQTCIPDTKSQNHSFRLVQIKILRDHSFYHEIF